MLQHHEVDAVLFADVEQYADIRMLQAGDGAGLAFEASAQIVPVGDELREDFDGDGAVEPRVEGFVHFPHPARAEGREDFIRAEAVSGREWHMSDSAKFIP